MTPICLGLGRGKHAGPLKDERGQRGDWRSVKVNLRKCKPDEGKDWFHQSRIRKGEAESLRAEDLSSLIKGKRLLGNKSGGHHWGT